MNIRLIFRNNIKTIKNIIQSVVEHDFFGMASEMGFMLCIGICPIMLFLTALFGWIGKKTFMHPILIFMHNIVPSDAMNVIHTVLNEIFFYSKSGIVAVIGFCITLTAIALITSCVGCLPKFADKNSNNKNVFQR